MTRLQLQRRRNRFLRAHHDLASLNRDIPLSFPIMSTSFRHEPVLAGEVVTFLRPASGRTIIDGTLGGGRPQQLAAEGRGAGYRL